MLLFFLQTTDPNEWNRTIAVATVVIAVATVLYLIATVLLWLTTRQSVNLTKIIFEASHRPYVDIEVERKKSENVEEEEEEEEEIVFQLTFENVGGVPAHNLQYSVRVIVDGVVLPMAELAEEPFTVLYPSKKSYAFVSTDDPSHMEAINNAGTLLLHLKCTYNGATGQQYCYEDKARYDKDDGGFYTSATAT